MELKGELKQFIDDEKANLKDVGGLIFLLIFLLSFGYMLSIFAQIDPNVRSIATNFSTSIFLGALIIAAAIVIALLKRLARPGQEFL